MMLPREDQGAGGLLQLSGEEQIINAISTLLSLTLDCTDTHCLFSHFSNGRAAYHLIKDRDRADIAMDQEANQWGRKGGNPNRFRPRGLDPKY